MRALRARAVVPAPGRASSERLRTARGSEPPPPLPTGIRAEKEQTARPEIRPHRLNFRCEQRMVRAGCHDDGILTRAIHPDQGDTGRLRPRGMHETDIHAGRGKARFEMIAEDVVSYATDHSRDHGGSAQSSRGTGLISALAAGQHLEFASQHSLARGRQTFHGHHKVHVETSYYSDGRGH